jgi:hypothetical protein
MAQIDRAVSLLQSNDEIDNRNGCALVINAAATASNIPDIINQGCIPLIVRRMNTNNDDLKMKCCWAINNLCVHDNGREAVHRAGVVNHFPAVLQSHDPETLKKACWALTNLARHPQAAQEIVRSGSFAGLIKILSTGDAETKAAALQPLCNLVLDPDHQLSFLQSQGLRPVIPLLSSSDSRTKELSVTLVSFITTSHDQIREALLQLEVLRPLNKILNGDGTEKMQELTLNTLVNLSLADIAEEAILNQGSVSAVVGLLNSPVLQLKTQAAMLLSNLLGNANIRAHIRYLGWMDPLFAIIQSAPAQSVQQAVRCIVNITFDNHCRYMLTRSGAEQKLKAANSRLGDSTISSLVETACKNFGVLVAADIQREVDEALRSGRVQNVAAPSSHKAQTVDNFAGLDELLGGSAPAPKPAAKKPATSQATRQFDDLDDLLGDAPAKKPSAPSHTQHKFDELDDLLSDVGSKPKPAPVQHQQKPAPVQSKPPPKPSTDFNDLDDLLNDLPSSKPATNYRPQTTANNFGGLDDLDALLGDMSVSTPAKNTHKPPSSHGLDDIDSLLADMTPAPRSSNTGFRNQPDDDIDSLLADLDNNRGSSRYGGHADQSIDDLLAGLGPSTSHRPSHGHDAIDDLLNDLTR